MPTRSKQTEPDKNRKTPAAAAKALAVASPAARASQADTSVMALLAQGEIGHNGGTSITPPDMGHNRGRPILLADFLTEEELCDQLRVHARTLKRWRDRGIGPPRTILPGRKAMYSAPSVRAWLASREEQPPAPPRSQGRPRR
jgi:hypothetical protein